MLYDNAKRRGECKGRDADEPHYQQHKTRVDGWLRPDYMGVWNYPFFHSLYTFCEPSLAAIRPHWFNDAPAALMEL
jgi:hypothetical protein